MQVKFEKWQACLNNFILVWSSRNDSKYLFDSLQRQAPRLCSDDGSGISADGILCLTVDNYSDLLPSKLTIINRDGSFAKNCGNGLRCAAASVWKRIQDLGKSIDLPEYIDLNVEDHSFICHFLEKKNKQHLPYTSIDMGRAVLNSSNNWHDEACNKVKAIFSEMKKDISIDDISTCSLQNNHISIFHEDASFETLEAVGQKLQKSELWDGINVHVVHEVSFEALNSDEKNALFSKKTQDCFEIWTWERGVGPTKACGSGSCAVASQVFANGFVSTEDYLLIKSSGGIVQIRQGSAHSSLELVGDAKLVFNGSVDV